jgi:hypothetical protein
MGAASEELPFSESDKRFQPDPYGDGSYATFRYDQAADLAFGAEVVLGRAYRDMGIITLAALDMYDRLWPDINKIRGPQAIGYIRKGEGVGNYTVIHILDPPEGQYQSLPTFVRCEGELYPGTIDILEGLKHQGRAIKEAAAFGATPASTTGDRKGAFRKLFEGALFGHNNEPPADEVWLMGMVPSAYEDWKKGLGDSNLLRIGSSVLVDPSLERVTTTITPALLFPGQLLDNLAQEYYSSAGDERERFGRSLVYFAQRLSPEYLRTRAKETQAALYNLQHEGA